MKRAFATCLVLAAMLAGLPLLGVVLKGEPIGQYIDFPPVTRYVRHAEFSLPSLSLVPVFA